MNKRAASWAAIAALVAGGLTGTAAQAEDTLPDMPVTGTVTANGVPQAGVEVSFYSTDFDDRFNSATTGADGTYAVSGVCCGPVRVVAWPGDGSGAVATYAGDTVRGVDSRIVDLGAGAENTVDIALYTKVGDLEGRVVSSSGKPVKGARVSAEARHRAGGATATTDAAGWYTLRDLPVDSYRLTAETSSGVGSKTKTATVRIGSTVSAGTITLTTTGSVTGRVKAPASTMHLQTVTVLDAKGRSVDGVYVSSKGKFTVKNLRPGKYRVVLDGANMSKKVTVKKGKKVSVGTFTRPKGTTISGVARSASGKLARRASVGVYDKYGTSLGGGWTDSKGRYKVKGALSGSYTVTLSPRSDREHGVTKTVKVKKGKNAYANLRSGKGASLTGTIVAKGAPAVGVTVLAVKTSGKDRGTGDWGSTDRDGRYRLDGLRPGTYRIVVSDDEYVGGYVDAKSKKTYTVKSGKTKRVATITVTD